MTSANPILRFAPSPNGRLHLGHAFSALFTARAAAVSGGTFLLRIEDIDPVRSKPEFDAGIVEDLAWLGLHWPEPALRQSARMPVYAAAAQALKKRGLLYPCFCTRRSITAVAAGRDPDGAPLYPGICRGLPQGEVEGRFARGEQAQWRLKMDRATAEAGPLTISEAPAPGRDALWGEMVQRPADPMRWGDAVLIRKDVPASYHLSVVADDAAQCITHVTRGMDLFAATDLHVLLQRLLGLPSPRYCHHRLLRDEEGQKLAKSKGSVSLKSLRDGGATAADVRHSLGFD
ncbi:MAG: tRNA glutamyl-Q(34) synthetase GluQRS [Rhodomicrobium sp.]